MRKKRNVGSREQARLFQIGDQWIGQEQEGGSFYRYWYDDGTKRVSRQSLRTKDLEEAKLALAKLVLSEPDDDPLEPSKVALASVFEFYQVNHGSKTRSARVSQYAHDYCIEFLAAATGKPLPAVSDFSLSRQHSFMRWCAERGRSTKTITIFLGQIKAAINYASIPRMITDSKGREREGQMLKASIHIASKTDEVSKITGQPMPKPRSFIPTDDQLVAFIGSIQREWLFRYVICALNTWARPEAILELDIGKQIDFKIGVVDMNQPGRMQNNKVRPLIRLTDNLRGWLIHWDATRPINRDGLPAQRIGHSDFRGICERAGVPRMTPYTLRHYMATRIRRLPEALRPNREERSAWLGHVDPHHRTTEEWYESHDPNYLQKCKEGIDAIMAQLNAISPRPLFAPNMMVKSGLTVISGGADEDGLPVGKCGKDAG